MRALQRCDFCDDEAVGTFEIVPPELEPTDAEQRRVLLCRDCEAQLGTLLEPLLARLDVEEPAAAGPKGGSTDERTADSAGGAAGSADDGPDSGGATTTYVDDETVDSEADENEGDSGADGSDDGDSGDSEGVGPGADADAGEKPDDGDAADGSDGEADDPNEAGAEAADAASAGDPRPPRGYGRVVRLLRNREFPMDRSDAESLVAGAYELEPDEVEAIVEYAIETGEFDEDGEELVRT